MKPQNKKISKKLFLSSDSETVIKKGIKSFFGQSKKVKICYVTTAVKGTRHPDFFEPYKKMMIKAGYRFDELDVEGKSKPAIKKILDNSDAVWVEGGNTFYLLKAIRKTGFDKILIKFIESGKPYFGTSAGSYILCPTIDMSTWRKPGDEKPRFGLKNLLALEVVPFLIKAHYKSDQKKLLKEKIENSKYPVKILKDGQALLIIGDKIKLIGSGRLISVN
ncbi:MAG: Type 1 glutamine amidotransferase-like domain-containing protein [Candidatus Buchananbacteria bacterium]|nr:Type 1 glutamine amidotransferase-like domain-containing protein [Candidatus Buchananbacteria bacterium]